MVRVIWSQRALKDLEDLGDYISKDSEKFAILTLKKLFNTAFFIESNPLTGRQVPEFGDKKIREVIKGIYRIIYQIKNADSVLILTVIHAARNLKSKNKKM